MKLPNMKPNTLYIIWSKNLYSTTGDSFTINNIKKGYPKWFRKLFGIKSKIKRNCPVFHMSKKRLEVFHNIKSIQAAQNIVNRRNKGNIDRAVYNEYRIK